MNKRNSFTPLEISKKYKGKIKSRLLKAGNIKFLTGFTLIELLVVIAIIGLLASIILVNVNSSRQKAQVAKSVAFSQQIYHALGSDAVGAWNFNDNTNDISGNGRNGTLIGGPTYAPSLVFSGGSFGKAINLNGSNFVDTANFADNLPNFTVSVWFKTSTTHSGNGGAIVSKLGSGGVLNGPGWTIYIAGSGIGSYANRVMGSIQYEGASYRIRYSSATYNDNNWHHAVLVVANGDTVNLYMDGSIQAGSISLNPIPNFSNANNVRIGNDYNNEYFYGQIDEVYIYSRALSQAEIQKHYAEGLQRHHLAVISNQ